MASLFPNLDHALSVSGITPDVLASELNISKRSLDSKLNGESPWLLSDAVTICRMLHNNDVDFLFLRLESNW